VEQVPDTRATTCCCVSLLTLDRIAMRRRRSTKESYCAAFAASSPLDRSHRNAWTGCPESIVFRDNPKLRYRLVAGLGACAFLAMTGDSGRLQHLVPRPLVKRSCVRIRVIFSATKHALKQPRSCHELTSSTLPAAA